MRVESGENMGLRTLVRAADRMGTVPLTTEVDPSRVRRKRDPGRCFRRAGWLVTGIVRGLWVYEAPPATRAETEEDGA